MYSDSVSKSIFLKKSNMRNLFLLIIFFFAFQSGLAQKMTTITYFANDTLQIQLDLYLPKKKSKEKTPLVLFAHGGGFSGGERQNGKNFCEFLSTNNFAAATISYTLYMKGKKFSCDGLLSEKIKAFQFGVNDVWLATNHFITCAKEYNIDISKIFISGSSAGGEAVLHAAFWDSPSMALYDNVLPIDFKYAGLISGAGAIMDLNLITPKKLIPIFLFHGDGDTTVPYGTAAHHYCKPNASGWLMLFGSHSIYEKVVAMNGSVSLYTFCGGGHEYNDILFEKEPNPILDFLKDVLAGKHFQNHDIVKTGKSNALSETYSFCN
jgi:poly(3-hydroxybutyrate) depolymerase